ncbi:MAG: polyphosphate kinase [Lysobacteraceae bacterium]|nr:MAG: polyphosphate kinase [Xanthomonadaceae bacterium]
MSYRTLSAEPLYFNRELSQLAFIRRVLSQAQDQSTPLLERVKFLCISCSVLDEFFEVRVASLRHQADYGSSAGADGLGATDTLGAIRTSCEQLVKEQYNTFNEVIVPALDQANIRFLKRTRWSADQTRWLHSYFKTQLAPVLSPLGLDPTHPFPRILNKSLNFAVHLDGKDAFGREADYALVRAPRSLSRLIRLPPSVADGPHDFVFLSSVIHAFVDELFPGMNVVGCYQFRITRNSELLVDEEEVEDLARALSGELLERDFARAVRMEVADNMSEDMIGYLSDHFELKDDAIYRCEGPVNLNRLLEVYPLVDRPELKYRTFQSRLQTDLQLPVNMFDAISARDILLHHPFDSFGTIIELLRQASQDSKVLAIKMTLYRIGANSPIIDRLIEAARKGRDVTAVVELRARFDEKANIEVSDRLQEAGVQVVHGVTRHKTHAKMLLIVRREGARLKRYAHLSTGNYHYSTASLYTDCGLLTCNSTICEDVNKVFQQISGLGPQIKLRKLLQSPFTLHKRLLHMIGKEARRARSGEPARIIAKMNSLTEPRLIRALYKASRAGVQIDLIVRGVCCLRPGVPEVSENISVRSVIGRFLEHSRVFFFSNGGKPKTFISSADWMDRNMFWRVETCVPILDSKLAEQLKTETLDAYLEDAAGIWLLTDSGDYVPIGAGADGKNVQERLLDQLT